MEAERPSNGLALIFDISGFTNFFNKPDLQYYITRYINKIVECVDNVIYGGECFWLDEDEEPFEPLKMLPSMRKFMGDGMLYIWEDSEEKLLKDPSLKMDIINDLYNVQLRFDRINERMYDIIPIADLPEKIKFGIAQGTIYKLVDTSGQIDYIGPCINLASRLVKYCKEVNFICSARLDIPSEQIQKNNYMKVIATSLRSFENEIVIIDKSDYKRIPEDERKRIFKEIKVKS